MKIKFQNIISLFLAFFIFAGSFVFYNSSSVSASSLVSSFPSRAGSDDSSFTNYFNDLKQNPNFASIDNGVVIMTAPSYGSIGVTVCVPEQVYDIPPEYLIHSGYRVFYGRCIEMHISPDSLSTHPFVFPSSYDITSHSERRLYSNLVDYNGFGSCNAWVQNGSSTITGQNRNYSVLFTFDNSYSPKYEDESMTGIDLSINEEGFYQWLIDNDKVSVDVSSGGVSIGGKIPAYIGMAKLKSFIHFYSQFGGSNSSFAKYIWQWFSHMNILNQTSDNVNILKQTTDSLYQEYLNSYMRTFYNNSANQVHHRRNIETNTTDDDISLITDDSNDTIDISILRDILRSVIQFQTTFADYMERLFAKIDDLQFVTTVVNDGGSTVSDVDLSELYIFDVDAFNNDLADFEADIEDVQSVPMGYISNINQNSLMPENMLEDKNSLTVNVPTITGFTVGGSGSTYSTQTGTYVLRSVDYPWLDTAVQKIKRFASILLILGYLVHLRYRIPELIRGE